MSPYSVVLPFTNNRGFYGVKENKLVTDDAELNSLVKFINHERARFIAEGNPLDCNINNWNFRDWYGEHQCIKQRNTDHLEEALESKGVKPDKFPIFFGSGNMASLLSPLLFDSSPDYETEFSFNQNTGLRFIAKDRSKKIQSPTDQSPDSAVGKQGHIAEYLLVTSKKEEEENKGKLIEIGRKLTYLINSLEFEGSKLILFSSKEVDCFWDREAPLNEENVCEVKAYNGGLPTEYGIKHIQLLVKSFALGGIRRLAVATITENFTTISKMEVKDIETLNPLNPLNQKKTLESFYACLNNFTQLIVRHCLANQLTEGSVETFRRGNESFMIIKDEEHFWCYLFDIVSADFFSSDRLKFPKL